MRREISFLVATLVSIFAALAGFLLTDHAYLRMLLATPLVLFLPGCAMLRAVRFELAAPGWQALACGLSMAACVLGGLLLNVLGGLNPLGWIAWLSAVSLVGALVALRRGAGTIPIKWPQLGIRPRHAILVSATVSVLALTVSVSAGNGAAFHPFAFTDFWMLPVQPDSNAYTVGIRNEERESEVVTLRVTVDGAIVGIWHDIEVVPHQTFTLDVVLPAGSKAEAWLLRGGPDRPLELFRKVSAALSSNRSSKKA
jgi:uncharacterized membrane protein